MRVALNCQPVYTKRTFARWQSLTGGQPPESLSYELEVPARMIAPDGKSIILAAPSHPGELAPNAKAKAKGKAKGRAKARGGAIAEAEAEAVSDLKAFEQNDHEHGGAADVDATETEDTETEVTEKENDDEAVGEEEAAACHRDRGRDVAATRGRGIAKKPAKVQGKAAKTDDTALKSKEVKE